MQAFKKVDMESWPRREHYRYYTEALKVEFNMTAPVDVQMICTPFTGHPVEGVLLCGTHMSTKGNV